jgi:hypothetical protein
MSISDWMAIVTVAALPSLGCIIVTEEHGGATSSGATSGGAASGGATGGGTTSGSTTSGGHPTPGACTELEGKRFASVPKLECGRGPNGAALCHWHLTFKPGAAGETDWDWQHSDYGETGTVQCAGATVTAKSGHLSGQIYTGTYDATQKKLTWDMVEYTLVP